MNNIRKAVKNDTARIAEIEVFNYRLNFYPIFKSDIFYFAELTVPSLMEKYADCTESIYVYDDGVVKGFIYIDGTQIRKLFVEPVLQGNSIGSKLLEYAVSEMNGNHLWALEKNVRAIEFYKRHSFRMTDYRKPEYGTNEYLVRLER